MAAAWLWARRSALVTVAVMLAAAGLYARQHRGLVPDDDSVIAVGGARAANSRRIPDRVIPGGAEDGRLP